jgi:hypothetical protein
MCLPKYLTQNPFIPRGIFLQVAAAVVNWWALGRRGSLLWSLQKQRPDVEVR